MDDIQIERAGRELASKVAYKAALQMVVESYERGTLTKEEMAVARVVLEMF